jgi:hypothetical protein
MDMEHKSKPLNIKQLLIQDDQLHRPKKMYRVLLKTVRLYYNDKNECVDSQVSTKRYTRGR